MLAETELSNIS